MRLGFIYVIVMYVVPRAWRYAFPYAVLRSSECGLARVALRVPLWCHVHIRMRARYVIPLAALCFLDTDRGRAEVRAWACEFRVRSYVHPKCSEAVEFSRAHPEDPRAAAAMGECKTVSAGGEVEMGGFPAVAGGPRHRDSDKAKLISGD